MPEEKKYQGKEEILFSIDGKFAGGKNLPRGYDRANNSLTRPLEVTGGGRGEGGKGGRKRGSTGGGMWGRGWVCGGASPRSVSPVQKNQRPRWGGGKFFQVFPPPHGKEKTHTLGGVFQPRLEKGGF